MTTTTSVRALPVNTILMVRGVSHRQADVHTVVEGDRVVIVHDAANPHDSNACAIETMDGARLGYVPKELAGRLAGPHPGGRWAGTVHEVYRRETWGLRVRLGRLIEDGSADRRPEAVATAAVVAVAGLRDRSDGVSDTDEHLTVLVTPPSAPVAPAAIAPRTVRAKSGRVLGTFVVLDGARVVVDTPTGARAAFPAGVVRIDPAT